MIIIDLRIKIHYVSDLQADGIKRLLERMKRNMLNEAEALHLKALKVSLQAVGVKALLTAKSYCNLGRLYQSQEKYMVIFNVFFSLNKLVFNF